MISGYTALNNYRYERKFVANISNKAQIGQIIRSSPVAFSISYPARQVNNIYFDTPGHDCYFDNLFGVSDRWKARIRWYGEIGNSIQTPVLELKIKHGHLGTKKSWKLSPILFGATGNDKQVIKKALIDSNLPKDVENRLISMQPVLLNNYQRDYFVSADKRFRLTLDTKLEYRDFGLNRAAVEHTFKESEKVVLELKYDQDHDPEAGQITTKFPFRLNKNSKYVSGMSFIRPGIAH
mgnify:CR=1 FL=1|jgi:SPX domain protein involved in polyphosphate accumulation